METPEYIDSKFRLAILAAKRAKQLVNGAKKRIDYSAENPLTVALEEINQGKINFQIFDQEELEIHETSVVAGEGEPDMDLDLAEDDDLEPLDLAGPIGEGLAVDVADAPDEPEEPEDQDEVEEEDSED